jgi:hypothetical protein
VSRRRPRNCETHNTRRSIECSDPGCPHTWEDCAWPDGAEACPHWHITLDVTVTVTPEMIEAAELLGASGAEVLGHAINNALRGGQT